ncbi:Uncharacterized membrane protein [Allopseudospirillum japonicum]|uniref:Uncharacterized membrane protein n=1 Tax=Allopseudospirillum japonicum TaxID=64971 RepID=A0A1H6Q0W9_9GAMM|nr:DUF599 family protein [Allopseudospirillum japonicum]SEI37511.1 Uncharacterized membrane protein [Allopseudospirillum japonicum]
MYLFGIYVDITIADGLALAWFIGCWMGYHALCQRSLRIKKLCLARIMHNYRRDWMRRLLEREVRIPDATFITHLERNGAFFASSTLLIVAALFALLGSTDKAINMVSELPFVATDTQLEWELKILLLIGIFIYAFFTFTWSMRQYNFCAIVIGSAPMPNDSQVSIEQRRALAEHTANLIDLAANQFNYGLRAYYFALAVLGWFLHPLVFMLTTLGVIGVLYRREFHSKTLQALAAGQNPSVQFRGIIRDDPLN